MINPFDYANPVTETSLFAGRSRELADIQYYTTIAREQSAIGLLVVGKRTSGKTSLLNMASSIAIASGLLSARIDLTQSDASTELGFLRALYEAVFLAGRKRNMWGEKDTPHVYEAFRKAIDSGDSDDLGSYIPLSFPKSYMSQIQTGVIGGFPAQLLVDDLRAILESSLRADVAGIALLIDEADHLASQAGLLEKLRNLMTASDRLLVVAAGTENMLARMDEVFSPIVRQFKRIRLKPFLSPAETRDCLVKRLQQSGESAILESSTYSDLHNLAQGQPYEAQLIAHYAYRRFRDSPSSGFSVTVTVLNDVLAEVERFQGSDHNRFASTLQKYSVEKLKQLASIVLYPRLTLHEKAKIDVAIQRPGRVKSRVSDRRRELRAIAQSFVRDGVVEFDSQRQAYELSGNQFDELYAKLLAQSKRVVWKVDDRNFMELTKEHIGGELEIGTKSREAPHLVLEGEVARKVARATNDAGMDLGFSETRYHEVKGKINEIIRSWRFRSIVREVGVKMTSGQKIELGLWEPTVLLDLGRVAARWSPGESVPTVQIRVTSMDDSGESSIWLQPAEKELAGDEWVQGVRDYLSARKLGFEVLGWLAEIEGVDQEEVVDVRRVADRCVKEGFPSVLDDILRELRESTIERYLLGEKDMARERASVALDLSEGVARAPHINNLAYIDIAEGEHKRAISSLMDLGPNEAPWADLPHYNLSIANAASGELEVARRSLSEQRKLLDTERVREVGSSVLHVVAGVTDGRAVLTEAKDLPLKEGIERSMTALDRELGSPPD